MTTLEAQSGASAYFVEDDISRLTSQADTLFSFDNEVIKNAVAYLRNSNPERIIRILDIGCANGYVTNTRFSHLDNVDILGIDKNKSCISHASKQYKSEKMKFIVGDIENKNLEMSEFDLIFCSYLMPHLANPFLAMCKLWKMLSSTGVLMVRAGDDGWKVNYP